MTGSFSRYERIGSPQPHARTLVVALVAVLAGAACGGTSGDATPDRGPEAAELRPAADDDALVERARAIHERILTIDTHDDIPFDFATPDVDPLNADRQVNLEKMRAGGLDVGFFIVYVGQTERTEANYARAKADAMTKFDAIHRMTDEMYPDQIGLAYTADDVERIHAEGKLVAAIGIENGYVIGKDLSLLRTYHDLGARYITLAHNGNNDIADSAQPNEEYGDEEGENGGISEFGELVIAEMNRLGIMVDVSHVSKEASLDAMRLSRAPVIASHSSVRALAGHPRNMDDEQLLALKENGGVMQTVALDAFVTDSPGATVEDFVDHIDYAVELIGVDHVGISSDFDGGGGVEGWMDASETFSVTLELVRRGYSEDDIRKLWGGNTLRVWRAAEDVSAEIGGR